MGTSRSPDAFTIERHGDLLVVVANPALEQIDQSLEQQVVEIIMSPILGQDSPLVLFDLTDVDYFGSMFLAVLLRCWKLSLTQGGMMVLSGVSERARELLRITSLDMVWPIYATRREAMEALLAD